MEVSGTDILIYAILATALGIAIMMTYQSKKNEKFLKRQTEELNFLYLKHVQSEEALKSRNLDLERHIKNLNDQQKILLDHQAHIEQFAYYDELTKLPNRHSLKIDLENLIEAPSKKIIKGGVLFIDFDNFKSINDHYGHAIGDGLLILIASKLSQSVEGYGKAYRFGSDEFIILLDTVGDMDSIEFIAQKIKDDFATPLSVMDNPFTMKFSMGISLLPIHANTYDEIISCADMAMYHAKSKGKGQYAFYKEESQELKDQLVDLKNTLQEAVTKKELDFLYQPIYNRKSEKVAMVETTLFWEEDANRISTPKMIRLANELDIVSNLNAAVFEATCDLTESLKPLDDFILVTFNLNMHDLTSPTLVDDIDRILSEKSVDPSSICMEIKGTSIESNYDFTLRQIEKLKSMGLRLIVDDFATEFMSINFLKKMAVDFIKIDYKLIFENERIVASLLEIINALGIQVIVKNIETREEAESLNSDDFHYVQGYFYALPLQKENFIKLMLDEEIKIYPKFKKVAQIP
ncbi:putative bifunctional diguanylate cyclase/phosphodiesterase [Fusibacter tunisiensis]|uniref:Diguanylate cyclase (GGDEF)-like protein n=1 Tax=Fusibacter tunisiensis TaxID=1008308 RepID=A0ABS2MRY5_9FIRM|nr:EAL domain-containing protein [Fusibacter tunisiensis]MBM7562154.1 diguanylate cyclase (GGDEF)-like protein [Fusibacter tunisiensis]